MTKSTKSQIFDDLLYRTLYSDQKFHQFITKHRDKIIPKFDNRNMPTSINDGINNKQLKTFISKYVKENIVLKSRMDKEKIKINMKNYKMIVDHVLNGEKHENESINEWIINNSNTILKKFNDGNCNKIN